ncbi:hypothetical protein BKA62DRAFT_710823 [Auriculariales sp. MPI-PUGE-AT-0066]|nr:hypothetical protein BKA62DRAFT_710823 [Auriculariales sp. MPI-PUGE-AT-0066]
MRELTLYAPMENLDFFLRRGPIQQLFPKLERLRLVSIPTYSAIAQRTSIHSQGATLEPVRRLYLTAQDDPSIFDRDLSAHLSSMRTAAAMVLRLDITPATTHASDNNSTPAPLTILIAMRRFMRTSSAIVKLRIGDGARSWIMGEIPTLYSRVNRIVIELTDDEDALVSSIQTARDLIALHRVVPSLNALRRVHLYVRNGPPQAYLGHDQIRREVRRQLSDSCALHRIVITMQFTR